MPRPEATAARAPSTAPTPVAVATSAHGARSSLWSALARRYGFDDARSWRLFVHYFRPHRRVLAAYALGSSCVSALLLPVVWLIRYAFETALPRGDVALLATIGALIVAIRLVAAGAALALRMQVVRVIKTAVARMREDLLLHVYARGTEPLTRADIDRLQTRIVQDTERVDALGNALLSGVLPALLSSVVLAIVLIAFSPFLVACCVLLVPLVWAASALTSRAVTRDTRRFQGAFEAFNKGVSFVLRQMDLTRVQGCEAQEIERQRQLLGELRGRGVEMSRSFAVHGQVQATVTGLVGIALLILGGIEVAQQALTLGAFIAFYFGAGLLNGYVSTVFAGTAAAAAGTVSLSTLAAIFDSGAPSAYRGTRRIEFHGRFTLRDVSFAYAGQPPVLRQVNLEIPQGARIAIVGANGAGKTTLLNLLLGLVAPTSGELLADGEPYAELDLGTLRRGIGVVMQRAGLFHGSIRRNITYGCEVPDEAELVAAARLAGLEEFIGSLPAGYETELGDGGISVSGGEAQRIAIARALLRRPRALILDEPSNHLDLRAVRELLEALQALPERPTIILVSHDLRLVELADTVFRVQGGSVRIESAAAGAAPALAQPRRLASSFQ